MPTLTINGQEIAVDAGSTVIQATEKLGIYVPRYCYHPGLPIAGSCRMCLVDIENMPKLAISCHTPVQEGMKVSTDSEKAKQARKSMLEFLLTNHPLDCTVCDQSGECDLQNLYMEIGQYDSRFLENKIKRKKAFPIGPHVVLDQERCILCTRCTRFCDNVSQTNELGVFNRGNRSVVDLYPGKALENPYSGNVIDICPVGALTEREFRFQCRVWYLSTQQSICNGCSRGCNIHIHFNSDRRYKAGGRRVQRLKPRFNPFVNQWWMCDEGRFSYKSLDQERIQSPSLRVAGTLQDSDWETVTKTIALVLRTSIEKFGPNSVGVIASPQLSNEELYLIRELFVEFMGLPQVGYRNPWEQPGFQDDFLIRADKNPNSRGAEEMGLLANVQDMLDKASKGEIKVLYVISHDLNNDQAQQMLQQTEYIIFQGTHWNSTAELAQVVLPTAAFAEKDGTFTNFEGRLQRFRQALLPLADSKPDHEIFAQLARQLEHPLPYETPEELFIAWYGKPYEKLDNFGEMLHENSSRDI